MKKALKKSKAKDNKLNKPQDEPVLEEATLTEDKSNNFFEEQFNNAEMRKLSKEDIINKVINAIYIALPYLPIAILSCIFGLLVNRLALYF